VVPSYVPTLGTLLQAPQKRNRIDKRHATLLAAAVLFHPDWEMLPSAAEEISYIKKVVPHATVLASLPGSAGMTTEDDGFATSRTLLTKLPEVSILHLACHGHQDSVDPLNSGFVMEDGMLTMANLMALHLPRAFFAFLSACDTARGDIDQPDQAVHLAATMLFAGFKSVIGTMW
jgi:CHAT domain-containing protein